MLILALVATLASPPSAPAERRLYPESLAASSFLWTDWNAFQENYHPNYVGDGDPKTAWVEGAKGVGAGEWLRINVTKMDGATKVRLAIRNGYQKSPNLYSANGRPQQIVVTLLPSGVKKEVTLKDAQGFQDVVIEQPSGTLEAVELKIASVYPGKKYEDTCISDVDVYVTATTRENPAYEKTLFEKLQAWRKDRIDAAKMFASKSKSAIPVAASYSFEGPGYDADIPNAPCEWNKPTCWAKNQIKMLRDSGKAREHDAALAIAGDALSNNLAGFTPVQAVPKDKRRTPAGDGVCLSAFNLEEFDCAESMIIPASMGFLRAETVGVFATPAPQPTLDDLGRGENSVCQSQNPKSFAWAKMARTSADAPEHLQALVFVSCGLVCSRDGLAPAGHMEVFVYNSKGELEVRVAPENAHVFDWNDAGKIQTAKSLYGTLTAAEVVAGR